MDEETQAIIDAQNELYCMIAVEWCRSGGFLIAIDTPETLDAENVDKS